MATYFAPRIIALLDAAHAEGLKTPKIRLTTPDGQPVLIYRAGPRSKWEGHATITDGRPYGESTYYGRIDRGTHRVLYSRERGAELVAQAIVAFDRDPENTALLYGAETGNCCFCARTLTDPRSNPKEGGAGYGPTCAEKYGLPWGEIKTFEGHPAQLPPVSEPEPTPSAEEDFGAFKASFGEEPAPEPSKDDAAELDAFVKADEIVMAVLGATDSSATESQFREAVNLIKEML